MMIRFLSLATVGLLCSSASAQTPSPRPVRPDRFAPAARQASVPHRCDSDDTAIALLRKKVDRIDWTNAPFEDVIRWLRAECDERTNIVPRWHRLRGVNVDIDTPVTLKIKHTTVADVLHEVIDQLAPDRAVAYRAIGNKLIISTRADFEARMVLRVYDVTDIVVDIPDLGGDAPTIELEQTAAAGGGRSPLRTTGATSTSGEQTEQEIRSRLEELARRIQRVIAPESWETEGADGQGRIEIFGRSLWVYNSLEVHQQIAGSAIPGG